MTGRFARVLKPGVVSSLLTCTHNTQDSEEDGQSPQAWCGLQPAELYTVATKEVGPSHTVTKVVTVQHSDRTASYHYTACQVSRDGNMLQGHFYSGPEGP